MCVYVCVCGSYFSVNVMSCVSVYFIRMCVCGWVEKCVIFQCKHDSLCVCIMYIICVCVLVWIQNYSSIITYWFVCLIVIGIYTKNTHNVSYIGKGEYLILSKVISTYLCVYLFSCISYLSIIKIILFIWFLEYWFLLLQGTML